MVAASLAESLADSRHEAGERHGILIAVADARRPHHHRQACEGLGSLVPAFLLQRRQRDNGELQLQGRVDLVLDTDLVVAFLAELQVIELAVHRTGRYHDALCLLVMSHGDGGVGEQCYLFLESVAVLRQRFLLGCFLFLFPLPLSYRLVSILAVLHRLLAYLLDLVGLFLFLSLFLFLLLLSLGVGLSVGRLVEALVGFLEERHEIIEFREVEVAVDLQLPVIGDGVAEVRAVLELRPPLPSIGRVVGGIGAHPGEDGEEVQRQLIAGGERLLVVEGRTEVTDACPHRVFPGLELVGIEVFVHGGVGLLDLRIRGTLEVHVQVLCQIPAHGELAVPQELLGECQRKLSVFSRLHVALLQFVVGPCHL